MTDQQFNSSSFDPSMRHDLTGVLRFVLTKFLQGVDGMLPAMVVATDRKTVSVQPLISVITTGEEIVDRPTIASLPVMWPGAGGLVMSFPIKAGDLGWIKSNDRDISLFLQSIRAGTAITSPPNTARKHNFSDAVFIPDTMSYGVTISDADANNLVIQSLDGTTKISMSPTGVINIVAPTSCTITSPVIDMVASTSITLTSPLTTITGAIAATDAAATAEFAGSIVATGNVTGAGISLDSHVHGGVMTGGSDTGVPI